MMIRVDYNWMKLHACEQLAVHSKIFLGDISLQHKILFFKKSWKIFSLNIKIEIESFSENYNFIMILHFNFLSHKCMVCGECETF
jgi:hypothetical protein